MIDLSNEGEQKTMNYGPVPAGSVVYVQMSVLEPYQDSKAPENPDLVCTKTGLRQLPCQFEVVIGTYSGVHWRENITAPASVQTMQLTPNQETACSIGGAIMKAIVKAANQPEKMPSFKSLHGLKFPVKVKINNKAYEKDGKKYWNNAIQMIITPDMQEFQEVRQKREIINPDGAVVGKDITTNSSSASSNNTFASNNSFAGSEQPENMDDVLPF